MTNLNDLDSTTVSKAAANTFFNIVKAWGLSDVEAMTLLGYEEKTRRAYLSWKSEPGSVVLTADKLNRLSNLFGIYKALQILLPDPSIADTWIKKTNSSPLFNGESALSIMLSGSVEGLNAVRQYLDSECAGN